MRAVSNKNVMIILYIVTMAIAFTTRYGELLLSYKPQIFIGLAWVALAVAKFAKDGFKFKGLHGKDVKLFLLVYFIPHVIIHLYTIALMLLGKVEWGYFTTNLTVYVPTLVAIVSVYFFGKNAFLWNSLAMIFSWVMSAVASAFLMGADIFPYAILQAYVDSNISMPGVERNYLEMHDLVLSIGCILVYVLLRNIHFLKQNFPIILAVLFIMFLGMKRISIIGIVLVIIYAFVLYFFKGKTQYKLCMIAGLFAFCACYFFIYTLATGDMFTEIVNSFGINTMGRVYYYEDVMDCAYFSPKFTGIGRNVVAELLQNELSYLRVGGVHSDIIKMYVENGFIIFGLWMAYYLFVVTKIYKDKYGYEASYVYFGLLIFTFSLYLTDNVENYYIYQIISICIPITYALSRKESAYIEQLKTETE